MRFRLRLRVVSPSKFIVYILGAVLLQLLVTVVCIWKFPIFYRLYDFLPDVSDEFPKLDKRNETLHCKTLIHAAKRILDGEKIVLPFENDGKTLWDFKARSSDSGLMERFNISRKKLETSAITARCRKFFVTFAHNCCSYSKRRAVQKAKKVGGFDVAASFSKASLSSKFRQLHKGILSEHRGAGYWLWKPYILLKVMIENMLEGDLVLYQDSGAYIIRPVDPLLKVTQLSKTGIVLFSLGPHMSEDVYTKQDAFTLMDVDEIDVKATGQRLASFVVFRKTCDSLQFVMEWLAYLSDRRIATDDANTLGLPNAESFRDHRHDQSVLSLLSKKWGLEPLRDPSQHGNTDAHLFYGPYEQIIEHDRFKY